MTKRAMKDPLAALRKTRNICNEVIHERNQQDRKWGVQNHTPEKWITILGEEFGEACKASLEEDWYEYREELLQVAAVAVAMVECFDRKLKG